MTLVHPRVGIISFSSVGQCPLSLSLSFFSNFFFELFFIYFPSTIKLSLSKCYSFSFKTSFLKNHYKWTVSFLLTYFSMLRYVMKWLLWANLLILPSAFELNYCFKNSFLCIQMSRQSNAIFDLAIPFSSPIWEISSYSNCWINIINIM